MVAEDLIEFFPDLTDEQMEQYKMLDPLYREWNEKINVISRKDIDALYEHHVFHSLAITRFIAFSPEAEILDLGTGGGFPLIPLAIYFPETQFVGMDGTAKKLKVLDDVAGKIGLNNVRTKHERAENHTHQYDFALSRGVDSLLQLVRWARPLIHGNHKHALPNGLIVLKGGKIEQEINALGPDEYVEIVAIDEFYPQEYFDEKYIIYVQG